MWCTMGRCLSDVCTHQQQQQRQRLCTFHDALLTWVLFGCLALVSRMMDESCLMFCGFAPRLSLGTLFFSCKPPKQTGQVDFTPCNDDENEFNIV